MEPPRENPPSQDIAPREPSLRELANSWLSVEKTRLNKEYERTHDSLEFNRGYRAPKVGSKPSWMEEGGLDSADWDAERRSSQMDEEGREDRIYDLESRLYSLEDGLGELSDKQRLVERGNIKLIRELANLEKERRAKLEESERKKKEEQEELYATSDLEIIPNPENVEAIQRWIKLKGGWGSGMPIEEYAEHAPEGITREDLQAAVLEMKPTVVYDVPGWYQTALADKILRDEFKTKFPNGASEEEASKYWENATIELYRPKTNKYDKFRNFGTYWTRGTLILTGDFGKDEDIGYGMRGGKIIVKGDVGRGAGIYMDGGTLEIDGHVDGGVGHAKTGGEIIVHNNTIDKYAAPQLRKDLGQVIGDQIESLMPSDFKRPPVEMEGAVDIENDLRSIMNLAKEGVIHSGAPVDKPNGWFMINKNLAPIGGSLSLVYYDGKEYSHRVPTVRVEISMNKDAGFGITVRDWRRAEGVEGHPFNKYGKARRGQYYSTRIKDGKAENYSAGPIIDSSHEFPSEERQDTREGFQQAQMYSLRNIVKAALVGIEK